MNNNAISASNKYTDYYSNVPSYEESSQIDKDAFLRLLVTQLKYQDPLEPLQDREFIAQITQFSSLEQMMNLTQTMQSFAASQQHGWFTQHTYLIGQKVEWEDHSSEGSPKGEGVVSSIFHKNYQIFAELEGGVIVEISKITRVEKTDPVHGEEEQEAEQIEGDEHEAD